ncbi:MAG: polyprenyl diphosphate synthase [Gammaproteobacteria bacterium]
MSTVIPDPRHTEPPYGVSHIAVVMDGNGRWAQARGMPRRAGHRAGVTAARKLVEACGEIGVPVLTLFAFSSENWRRPPREVQLLMGLFVESLQREVADLHKNNVQVAFIGDTGTLSQRLQTQITSAEALTRNNTGLKLRIAVSYGGRWDLAQAAKRLAERVESGEMRARDIDEEALDGAMSLADVPDPDLFIRTGGEKRISNFLMWNLAYSELYFSDVLWPDFDATALTDALSSFESRQRRYGRTAQQIS